MTNEPRIAYASPALRVVETPKGPIVELPDGRDSLGAQRWIRAVLSPDRLGIGEPVIEGWPAISTASGYSVSTLRRWRKRTVNPLPLQKGPRGYRITRSVLTAWLKETGAI